MTYDLSKQLQAVRAEAERHMRGTAVIYRAETASDDAGGLTTTWAAAGTVSCAVGLYRPGAMPIEGVAVDQVQAIRYWLVTMPHDTDVTVRDRLSIAGIEYEVLETNAAEQDRPYVACKVVAIE